MCGRIALTKPERQKLKTRFKLKKLPKELVPRFNISPSQEIPVILNKSPDELSMVKWGLLPSWSKEETSKYSMINAKAETITEKPSYRGPIKHKRCLIIVDTFYEWKQANGAKKPFRIFLKDEEPFALAGVWDCWAKQDKEIYTCSIITTSPNKLMKTIHDRMPVILPQDKEDEWLSDIPVDQAVKLLNPYDGKDLQAYEVSTVVNSPKNDLPEVIEEVDPLD